MTSAAAPHPVLTSHDFEAMAQVSTTCVLLHDARTKAILWANPAACEMLGWDVDELRPLTASDMSSPARQYDRVIGRWWLQVAVDKGINRVEWHYRSRSGRVIPTETIARRVELARGPAVMVQFRDIEREQATADEHRMRASYLEFLAHHTSTIALMLDLSGLIVFGTDSALRRLGADVGQVPGHLGAYARLRADGDLVDWQALAAQCSSTVNVQLEIPRPGAEPGWLEGTLERLHDDGTERFLMILHDASLRVQGEVRRRREAQKENYQARYTAMGDMAMAIAHELGQPLAAAQNFLAAVRGGDGIEVTEARRAYGLDAAGRQIERAAAIVNSLRSFVADLEHIEQDVDLNDVVEECLHFVHLRAQPAGVAVVVQLSATPVVVRCERVLTGQVLLNLCFNAIDELGAVPRGRRTLTVGTQLDGAGGLVTVDDTGRGLDHDPFSQPLTSKDQGSGLGLALSHRIVARQRGTVWAEPRPCGGSRFAFRLPVPDPADVARRPGGEHG